MDNINPQIQPSPLLNDSIILELEEFWIHIFVVYDTTDVRGIVMDEDRIKNMRKLAAEMKIHYNNEDSDPGCVTEGKYYAVFDEEWYRVKCISCDSESQRATVLFIDRGDEDVFDTESLQLLHPRFCTIPAQYIKLSLYNLEIFKYCTEIQTIMDALLPEENIYAKVMEFERDENDVLNLSVELTFGKHTEKEISVNDFLLERIFNSVVDPKIFIGSDKVAQEAHVSFISNTQIFMQIKSKGLIYLEALMNNLIQKYLNNEYRHKLVSTFDLTKMYITKNPEKNSWCRVKIINIKDENEALVMFVDVGNTAIIRRSNLILLENLSKLLARYPEQAVEVKLHKISPFMFDENMATKLRKLASHRDILYAKVVGEFNEIPIVQFSKRIENNSLVSINDALIVESSTICKYENSDSMLDTIDLLSDFPLQPPTISEIGSYFDVYITMVAHPDDFTVQPLCNLHKLKTLMANLLDVCESFSGPHLTSNSVKIGCVYAAQNEDDDTWYRAYVYKIISKTVFAVYACDYGDYKIVPLKNLQPLQKEFYDLPCQAIKAKLVGLTPEVKDSWKDSDTVRFIELLHSKRFVAFIKSQEVNQATVKGVVLSLELIDTNADDDIYIVDIFNNDKQC